MHDIYIAYDDTQQPESEIQNIIGQKTFGNVILQRRTLKQRFLDITQACPFLKETFIINGGADISKTVAKLEQSVPLPVIHIFSAAIFLNEEQADIILRKVRYAKQNIAIISNSLAGLVFKDTLEYIKFLKEYGQQTKTLPENIPFEKMLTDSFVCIDKVNSFLSFLTQGFDARYFNSLSGDDYVVVKTSPNKEKIKKEYTFYHLLPEAMRMWFVMPFDYKETKDNASYSMERYHVCDIAIKWVNNSLSVREFTKIMDKLFYFIGARTTKGVTQSVAEEYSTDLYITKVFDRLNEIKKSHVYEALNSYIKRGTSYNGIDDIFADYKALYEIVSKEYGTTLVIGHGDLCFSNILYHNESGTLKFIDVKGALTQDELWADPYYDIAKLSHSVCGRYDFFNSNLYDISLSYNLQFNLNVDFDNSEYIEVFKEYLAKNDFNYTKVRLLEASLFLSMLPLHIDYPKKVFGFLLNAIDILSEVKKCLKK